MVRFNDKTQISSLASNDIMPITDMSDTTDDRKVTVQQLSQFAVDNIPTLSGGKTLTDNNLTNTLKGNYDTAYANQDLTKYDSTVSYPKGYWVTGIVDDQKVVKESLVDGNLGNPLTDDTKWKDVALGGGGGGGLEIGDIGIAPLGIDESENKRRYLNGQVIIADQYTSFANKLDNTIALYPNLAKTESEWQAISALSVGGQCGYFVVDKTAGTIRLPKIIMPIQGLTDLSKLGDLVEAGLPNVTAGSNSKNSYFHYSSNNAPPKAVGAVKLWGNSGFAAYSAGGVAMRASIDASLSSSIYGNSTTVQQEQIQYPYFIQVATGVEESIPIINQLELNNPYTLFDCKYSETKLYNIAWLRSEGQWNSKATHPKAYEALLVEQNPEVADGTTVELPSGTSYTKRGVSGGISAKLSSESYDDYDFVVNTSDETFRLPIKSKLAGSKFAKGNGMTLGLTDDTNNFGLVTDYIDNAGGINQNNISAYGQDVGTSNSSSSYTGSNIVVGITTDSSKSGIELDDSNLYLYYYVGETVQNANLINAGRIEERLTSVIPDNKELITSYGMPDYASGVTVTQTQLTSGYTFPSLGVLIICAEPPGSGTITIDGLVFNLSYSTGTCASPIQHYGKAGTEITYSKFYQFNNAYFCPLIGVN